ncbi:hypothetical protein H2O64_11810 [Kordia sp. YSTF-M3]|uniref:Lipoprotein n=1 Tax=Kordia aestuariivivens TaxID=2759037 RepID=A0ABR7Q9X0_9FLAO|nr:hypothetical protein [Kordia aestuariivivens]MBC8755365.1 hypothetical protein [Kordia aestuariivivens]
MKTFTPFFLIAILFTFVSCNQKTKTVHKKTQEKETTTKLTDTIVQQKVVSHESETIKKVDLKSKLEEKVARLSQLEHNYQVKSIAIVHPEKTLLLGRLQHALKLKDSLAKEIDLASIKKELHEARKSFLKATKSMTPNGNTYPRVTIEEYIFKTQESATTAFETLMDSKKNGGLWTYVSKEPSVLFLEENKMYFVNTGGYYMLGMEKDIAEKIKD